MTPDAIPTPTHLRGTHPPSNPVPSFLAMPTMLAVMDALATIRLNCPTCDRVIAPWELGLGLCLGCSSPVDCDALRDQADAAII